MTIDSTTERAAHCRQPMLSHPVTGDVGRRRRASSCRPLIIAALFATALPGLAGCVSGVNDVSAFGFTPNTQLADDDRPIDVRNAPEVDVASLSAEQTDELEKKLAASKKAEETAAAAASEAEAAAQTDKDADRSLIRTSTNGAAVAAYAGGRVSEGGASGSTASGRKTLFQSLFARAEAKTPIPNAERGKGRRVILNREGAPTASGDLPGVDSRSIFEIGQRNSAGEADALEDAAYEVASLGSGFARFSANGLAVQRESVETRCFPSALVGMLRQIERKFGSRVIVTSGYRSPSHNKRVNGAKRSQHMACKAADIIVPNADMRAVASYVRSLNGRGGVGTYCHTKAIHVDVGPERDWNWRCRRRRG